MDAWGTSEANEEYLRRAHAVCPVTAIQNRYSMMARWHEKLFPVVEELGIANVAFSPMANGFLTGQYTMDSKFEPDTDFCSKMPQYTKEGFEKAHELLELLKTMAKEKTLRRRFPCPGCCARSLISSPFQVAVKRITCMKTLERQKLL